MSIYLCGTDTCVLDCGRSAMIMSGVIKLVVITLAIAGIYYLIHLIVRYLEKKEDLKDE